jgi:7-carboxy-7-deazaguanine synthase (Cx14CxxC type)
MTYTVKEIYVTLQGEGAQTGRAAVFLRFAGCNLWSGREEDRSTALCTFCDTDFIGTTGENGGKYKTSQELMQKIASLWKAKERPYIVCTGGEPLLQMDQDLVTTFHAQGFEIAIETNGTMLPSDDIKLDWICVSPKGSNDLQLKKGNEIKLVYPQKEAEAHPDNFKNMEFDYFFLQPLDVIGNSKQTAANIKAASDYCMQNPQWRLSLQTHKMIGLP